MNRYLIIAIGIALLLLLLVAFNGEDEVNDTPFTPVPMEKEATQADPSKTKLLHDPATVESYQ